MLFVGTLSILLAIHIGGAVVLLRRAKGWIEGALAVIVLASLWVVLSLAALRIFVAPQFVWNDARLGEVLATLKHYPLYMTPGDGPIRSYKYGPFGALTYLPAGLLAQTPTNQMLLGALLTTLYFFLPVVWVIRRAAPRASPLMQIAAFACFAAIVHISGTLSAPSSWIHTDAPALGLAACSIALMLSPRNQGSATASRIGAALCAALAVWTKQTIAPILIVLPLWSLLTQGRREALVDAAYLIVSLLLVSIACLQWFDPRAMEYYMLVEAAHHPWQYTDAGSGEAIAKVAAMIFQQTWPIALLLVAAFLLRSEPRIRPMRSWLHHNGWMLAVIFAIILAPPALFGWLKAGGASNNAALITYFLLLAAVSALAQFESPRFLAHLIDAKLLGQAMVVLLAAQLATRAFFNDSLVDSQIAEAIRPDQNDSEVAYRYEESHPGDVYFPWNLEASLQASGKLYHFDYGVHDRILADTAPGTDELLAGLPPNMRAIAYPPQVVPSLDMLGLLPDFRQPLHIRGLEGFIVYGRTQAVEHLPAADEKLLLSLSK